MRGTPFRRGSAVRLPARGRLLATGDLHDNPFNLAKVMRVARLDASPDHHVVLHEMIHGDRLVNGLDLSYRMLARVAEAVVERPDQVHPVLANHELAQMTGRGVSKGAGNSVEMFAAALDQVFGDAADDVALAVARFIRAFPLAVIAGRPAVLCAHSIPSRLEKFDLGILDRELDDADYDAPHGSAWLMTWGRAYGPDVIEALASRWGVKLFCLGHEHVETGIETRGSRVVVLNSDHERATVLPIDIAAVPTAEEAILHAVPLAAV
jgi:hypothetical protein